MEKYFIDFIEENQEYVIVERHPETDGAVIARVMQYDSAYQIVVALNQLDEFGRELDKLRPENERQRLQMLRLLDEAERVVLSDAGSRYTRLREAVNEVRQFIGLGPLTDALSEYPIRISRREAMELSSETRRKVMARMTDAFMDAMEVVSRTPEADVERFYGEDGE